LSTKALLVSGTTLRWLEWRLEFVIHHLGIKSSDACLGKDDWIEADLFQRRI